MTIQKINIGNKVNDGLGDDLRTAFEKVNSNFTSLEESLTITASNVGATGAGIFKQKNGSNLEFKKIIGGRNIILTEFDNSIEIADSAEDAFVKFDTDTGVIRANSANKGNITLEGTPAPGSLSGIKDIEVSTDEMNYVRFKTILPVTEILTTYDFGVINGSFNNAIQVLFSNLNVDYGTILNPGTSSLDLGKLDPFNNNYN
jgi:hypothetical protein